jgi:hypothetical protein
MRAGFYAFRFTVFLKNVDTGILIYFDPMMYMKWIMSDPRDKKYRIIL